MAAVKQPLRDAETGGGWGPAPVAIQPTNSWGVPPPPTDSDEPLAPMSVCQFLGACGALLLALPAIIGAWCWPMVVAAIFNVGASVMNGGAGTGAVDFFHGFQVAIMMTLMLNLVQFTYWTCKLRRPGNTLWEVHGPTMMVFLSFLLVNIQPLMILVIGSWKLCCAECAGLNLPKTCTPTGFTFPPWPNAPADNPYRECHGPNGDGGNVFWDKSYCTGGKYAIFPTVWQGWVIQVCATWGGYLFMFIGVFQATQLHKKLAGKWRAIRSRS